jgi:hypothetical protein
MAMSCTDLMAVLPTGPDISRHLQKGPQTGIGVVFEGAFAKRGFFPTYCAICLLIPIIPSRRRTSPFEPRATVAGGASACVRSSLF